MARTYVSSIDLVAELQQLCHDGKTGKYIITAANNSLVSFGLQQGRIVAVNAGIKSGTDAIRQIATIGQGSGTFMGLAQHSGEDKDLPPNDVIFDQLTSTATAVETSDSSKPSGGAGLSADDRQVLEQTMANYIGPMAGIVCARALASVTDPVSAIDALAKEIPDPSKAQAFVNAARSKL